jgi:hypothetical protein
MQDTLNILLPETSDTDFIEHHGVKAMHWGVRKAKYKQNVKSIKQKYKKQNKELYRERRKEIKNYLTKPSGFKKAIIKVENIRSYKDKVAINKFKESQELKRAKSTLYKDVNKNKSDKYLKKANEQFMKIYSNRMVIKKPDGSFQINRYYSN